MAYLSSFDFGVYCILPLTFIITRGKCLVPGKPFSITKDEQVAPRPIFPLQTLNTTNLPFVSQIYSIEKETFFHTKCVWLIPSVGRPDIAGSNWLQIRSKTPTDPSSLPQLVSSWFSHTSNHITSILALNIQQGSVCL